MDNRRATAIIDLGILEDNYRTIKAYLPSDVKMLCVVKADAYGHGMVEVARKLESIGADYLGVATISEGEELRRSGVNLPVLVMSGMLPWEELQPVVDNNLTLVIYDLDMLNRVKNECTPGNFISSHIKIDTGMGRLGFSPESIPFLIEELKSAGNIKVEGVMSHFSSSEKRDAYGVEQVRVFENALRLFRDSGIETGCVHMANSGAIRNYPEAHFSMIRAGLSLYGSCPAIELKEKLPVKQVMKFVSYIALIREFPPGLSLSYGRSYTTEKKTRIAYTPVGYADGYPRALSNKGFVLIRDKRCSVVGKVCMDWILVDVTDFENVRVGEKVILLGNDQQNTITADEMAILADTIPYEILCKISRRVPRIYI